MKITEFGTVKTTTNVKRRDKTSQATSSFADFLDVGSPDDISPPAHLSDVSASSAISNMLALQEISEEEIERKRVVLKGKNILDELDKLRHQLLIGAIPLTTLQNLVRQLSVQRQMINDPKLMAVLDDIELRAAVELAKLEMAAAAKAEDPTV